MSLFALGLTLVAISFKQLKPAAEASVRKHLIDLPDDREASHEKENTYKSG
ncbi:hypothetical protein [Brevibacillus laterosporus]|uniref:hypothetical protein n=1 Tax=Brevibacillus laterosporus TaxID=1465 RepID=UPI0015E1E758|nr:hypothetical protein [Brevibacillus laterosporus]MED1667044.1 hypothetical protein [Brevibacillus laterosporus]MED1671756.1 hypothetical protein [Brevibacillus laterosporus]MED1721093.1 hypothetical protein [Brevibacillus laterosporus]